MRWPCQGVAVVQQDAKMVECGQSGWFISQRACDWGFSDLACLALLKPRAGRSFKRDFPRRLGRLERRCAPPHASPAPPCVRASLTCPVPACAGLCHSTCPCCRCSFDGIPGQPQRHLGARAPPCSPGRSRLTSPGAPASAQIGPGSVRALPLARPPLAAPSPTLLSLPACRTTRRPPRGASLDDHTNA